MKNFLIVLSFLIVCSYNLEVSAVYGKFAPSIRRDIIFKQLKNLKTFNISNSPECLKTFEKRGKKQLLNDFNNTVLTHILNDEFNTTYIAKLIYYTSPKERHLNIKKALLIKLNEVQAELLKPYFKVIVKDIYLHKAWNNYFTSRRMLKEIDILVNNLGLEKPIRNNWINEIISELNPNIQHDQRAEGQPQVRERAEGEPEEVEIQQIPGGHNWQN